MDVPPCLSTLILNFAKAPAAIERKAGSIWNSIRTVAEVVLIVWVSLVMLVSVVEVVSVVVIVTVEAIVKEVSSERNCTVPRLATSKWPL